jgi:hypothetical protein
MRRDWFLGFGAFSTLVILVGLDVALALLAHRGQIASAAIYYRLRAPRDRQ